MTTRRFAVVATALSLAALVTLPARALAQSTPTQVRVGAGFGPRRGTDSPVGFGGQVGVYGLVEPARPGGVYDAQVEFVLNNFAAPANVTGSIAALLRFKPSRDENFEEDPSPRFHFVVGPGLEIRHIAGAHGAPRAKFDFGIDITRRHSVIELRYSAARSLSDRTGGTLSLTMSWVRRSK